MQDARLQERAADPWQRAIVRDDDRSASRPGLSADALDDMCKHTDTRWSPWRMIDGNDEQPAAVAALDRDRRRLGRGDARRAAASWSARPIRAA